MKRFLFTALVLLVPSVAFAQQQQDVPVEIPASQAQQPRPLTQEPPESKESEDGGGDPAGRKFRLSGRLAGGFEYDQVAGIPVTGIRGRALFGFQNDNIGHYFGITFLYGSTENDLRTVDFKLAYQADLFRYGILRLGIDGAVGYLSIKRVTHDSRMWALGLGGGVHATVDLVPFGPRQDGGVFVEARLEGHVHFGTAFTWGPQVLAGVRF